MRIAHTINLHGYEENYWAIHQDDLSLDIVPTVLFAWCCDHNNWAPSTKRVYSHIVDLFFRSLRSHGASFKTLSNEELRGFMQGYYLRKLSWQKTGDPLTEERMDIVEFVLRQILKAGMALGLCATRNWSFSFKKSLETQEQLSDVNEVYTNYISPELFDKFHSNIISKNAFERRRDRLSLRLGYESGLRSHELVRSDNFHLERFHTARVDYRLGDPIEWTIVGKGRNGGKLRYILIQPNLALTIFEFIDDFRLILQQGNNLFAQRNGACLSPKYLTNLFSGIRDRLRSAEIKHLSSRSLRHSYATNLANYCHENGINLRLVQDRLGHSDWETTKIYLEVAHLIHGREYDVGELREPRPMKWNRKHG